MRERFAEVASRALDEQARVAVVLADIGVDRFAATGAIRKHPDRVVNVGIREQLLISVAGGMALEGMRPIVHSYTPFLVERPFEQIKLDLGHQDVGAVLVSIGASYDAAAEGRTHQSPGDVALLSTLPDWTIHVPGHPDEAATLVDRAISAEGCVYVRLSDETNGDARSTDGLDVVRRGSDGSPVVLAVGPTLSRTLDATADLDVTVTYTSTVRPFPAVDLRRVVQGDAAVLVEPTLAGTSAAELARALSHRPTRQLALGVANVELRRYGTAAEHRAAHGLDARGIRRSIVDFLSRPF